MKIFLDDFRNPEHCIPYMHQRIGSKNPIYLEEWLVVRDYKEFVDAISKHINEISHVSFDHDLADEHYTPAEYWDDYEKSKEYQDSQGYKEKTGLDCARWMREFYETEGKDLPIIFVHSMNPVGTNNIINEFKSRI